MVAPEDFILIGRLGRPRGLQGELFVTPVTDFPERFLDLKEIHLEIQGGWRRVKIEYCKMVSGRPLLKLTGVNTPEEASRLTNLEVAVTSDQLVELPEGTFFVFDLIGCGAFDEKTGKRIGEVVDVQRYPANDVYVIQATNGKEMMLPAVSEFVRQVDTKQGRIVIATDGLLNGAGDKTGHEI